MEEEDGAAYYTLDEALSAVGFGRFQSKILVFAGIGWFSEAMEMNLLSFVGPAVKSEWDISATEESLLSTAVFGGMLIGAYFWGFVSDAYGRRIGIRGLLAVIAGSGLLSSFSPSYVSLLWLRCLLGFGIAGGHIFGSWLLEFIPSLNRGAWMFSLTIFWILGELFEASLAWIVMPRFGWRWLLALSSAPPFITLMLSIFIPESPRYLYMKGKTIEALTILDNMAMINGKKLPTGTLLQNKSMLLGEECVSEENHLLSSNKNTRMRLNLKSMFELFSPDLLSTTLLLWSLHFTFTFAYYGVVLMTSALSSTGDNACASNTITTNGNSLYVNVFITSFAELPGLMAASLLVDRAGRKLTMEILIVLGLVLVLPLSFHQNGVVTTGLLFSARMFLSAGFSTLTIYAKEVYPTSIRGSGSGLATSMGRIGGMICPLVAVGLVRGCHQTAAVLMFGAVIMVSVVCVVFFPFETKGKGLRDIVDTST